MDQLLNKLRVASTVLFVTQFTVIQVAADNEVNSRTQIIALFDKIGECMDRRDSHVFVDEMEAVKYLASLPSGDVAAVALERIESDSRFQRGSARKRAYGQLARPGAREIVEVRQQLFRGLTERESEIVFICAEALSHAEENVRTVAVEKLISQGEFSADLLDGDSEKVLEKLGRLTAVIEGLGHFGPDAKDYLESAVAILHNQNLIELRNNEPKPNRFRKTLLARTIDSLRSTVAKMIIQVGGMDRAIEAFQKIDPVSDPQGDLMVTGALLHYFLKLKGEDKPDGSYRKELRRRVLRQLGSPSLEVRKTVPEILLPAFGDDLVVFRSPTDYEWNPTLIGALEKRAAEEPDEELRTGLADLVARFHDRGWLDRTARRILQQREADKIPSESPNP